MKKLAIVTVDYNGHEDTAALLSDLARVDLKDWDSRIIVVDNGSRPGLLAPAKKAYPGVDVIQTGENKGFAGGYNFGLKYAYEWGADYLWIINNDTLVKDKDAAKKLVQVLLKNPQAGVVSPKIRFAPGYEFYKDRYKKSEIGKVIWYAGGVMDWANVLVRHRGIDEVDRGQYDSVSETEFVSGCSFMSRREVFEKAGYFDEVLFAYFEDVEWMLRVAQAGFLRMYAGNTEIYHKVSRTAGIGSPLTDYLLTRNRLVVGMRLAAVGWRTKLALAREAVKILVTGREAQRRGVWDALDGAVGPGPYLKAPDWEPEYETEVSVVTINYKTAPLTEGLVKSILKKGSGFEKLAGEIVVVDNASGDDMAERIKKYPGVKFIGNRVNNGFAGGNNQAMRFAKGKYLLMLNSDMEIKPGAINEMLRQAEAVKGKAVLGAKLVFPDGTVQDSCYNLPTVGHAMEEYFLGKKGSYFMYAPPAGEAVAVEGVVMACFMIPRVVLNRVGPISEETFMYFEDIEYCRRLREAGIPVLYCRNAEIIHYHGMSSKQIGVVRAVDYLKKGSLWYHGPINYALLWLVLWLGQKWGRTATPKSKWAG